MRLKIRAVVIMLAIAVMAVFASCGDDSDFFTRSDIEGRDEEAVEITQKYLDEKYGEIFTVTEVQLRPKNNEVFYVGQVGYMLYASGNGFAEADLIIIDVLPKRNGKKIELYVDNDNYYGYLICDRMRDWLGSELEKVGINEYFVHFFEGIGCGYPADYPTDATALELIQKYPAADGYRSPFSFTIEIPESEYNEFTDELDKLVSVIEETGGDMALQIRPVADEDYFAGDPDNQDLRDPLEILKIIKHIDVLDSSTDSK